MKAHYLISELDGHLEIGKPITSVLTYAVLNISVASGMRTL